MGNIEQIHVFPNCPLDIIQKTDKAKAAQSAVYKQINIAFLCCGSLAIGTKQQGSLYPIPGKDRSQDGFQLRQRVDCRHCAHHPLASVYPESRKYATERPAKPAKSCQESKAEKTKVNDPVKVGTAKQTVEKWRSQNEVEISM